MNRQGNKPEENRAARPRKTAFSKESLRAATSHEPPIQQADDATSEREPTRVEREDKFYKELVDAMNDAAFLIGADGRFLEVNKTAVDRYGYTYDEFLQMTARDLAAPELLE